MGQRGTQFTKRERERLLGEVQRAWCRGDAAWEIGRKLEVSDAQVEFWIVELKRRWRQEFAEEASHRRDAELTKLDELERTYWRAWIESMAPKETTMTERGMGDRRRPSESEEETAVDDLIASALEPVRVRLTTERRDGNPAFLAGVLACIDRRCRLLGLDEPQAVEITMVKSIAAKLAEEMGNGLTEQDVLDEAKRILDEAKGGARR